MRLDKAADPATKEKHARSTIEFSDGAGTGAIGTVSVFTVTGRVLITKLMAFCTDSLTGAAATLELGEANDVNGFIGLTTGTVIDVNLWWGDPTPVSSAISIFNISSSGEATSLTSKALSTDIIVTVKTAAVTDGTIIFDVWYQPITDGGSLAPA